jgi:hypothetical protein
LKLYQRVAAMRAALQRDNDSGPREGLDILLVMPMPSNAKGQCVIKQRVVSQSTSCLRKVISFQVAGTGMGMVSMVLLFGTPAGFMNFSADRKTIKTLKSHTLYNESQYLTL